MSSCPNVNSKEWKELVASIGEKEAMRDFMETGTVRNLDEVVRTKPQLFEKEEVTERVVPDTNEVVEVESQTAESFAETNPDILDEQNKKITRGNEIINKLVDRLSNQLGISAVFTSEKDALEMLQEAGLPYNGESGFFYNGRVYLVRENLNTETVFHEFAHPLLRSIAKSNPALFENLYQNLLNTPEGYALVQKVKANYPELAEGTIEFKEEVLAKALGKSASNRLENTPDSTGFTKFIKDLLYAIKQLLRQVFKGKKLKVENLDVNTSLDQLADMLKNDSFVIESSVVTQADIVSFSRDFRKQIINDLSAIDLKAQNLLSKEFYSLSKKQEGFIKSKNYKEIAGVLKDKMDRGDLSEILANLRAYQTEGERVFADEASKKKYMDLHAEALLNSFLRFDQASARILQHFKEIVEDVDNKQNLIRAYYLNRVIKDWAKFLETAKTELLDTGKFSAGHPLFDLINQTRDRIDRCKKYSDSIYTAGVSEMLVEQLDPIAKSIDNHYERIIDIYRKKGASQEIIDLYIAEYEAIRLTPEKIEQLLKGELGDASALNSYLEGYMYNQDPIVLGFAGYVKNKFMTMNSAIQQQYNRFINDIEPLVRAAGYTSAYSRMTMGKDLLFVDTTEVNEAGETVKSVWKFKGPFKGYQGKLKMLRKNLEDAKKVLNEGTDPEARLKYVNAIADLEQFKKQYMYRPYTDEYYKLDDMFSDDVGREAYARMQDVLNKIRNVSSIIATPEEVLEALEESKIYWRQFKQLKDLNYPDGTPKDPDSMDYKVAMRLQERGRLSNKFHEWVTRKGAFENAYLAFLDSIEHKVPGSEAYEAAKAQWIKNNTVTKLNDNFYRERAEIFAELASLSEDNETQKRIVEIYSTINNLISSYRDANSHPVGSEMPKALLDRIKSLEDELQTLQNSKDAVKPVKLTKIEWQTYTNYKEKLLAYRNGTGEMPTTEETNAFLAIKELLKGGAMTDEQLEKYERRRVLFKKLSDLRKKTITEDYVDTINSFITGNPETLEYLKKELGISEFTVADIDLMYLPQHLSSLMAMNPSYKITKSSGEVIEITFSDWFNNNHTVRTYEDGGTTYTPTAAWTATKPQSSRYYEQTDIFNPDGSFTEEQFELYKSYREKLKNNEEPTLEEVAAFGAVVRETIDGVPGMAFKYRQVKDSYIDDNGNEIRLKTERITMLDCIERGIGIENATVDMRGEWLPRYDNPDKTYINEEYENLRSSSPEKFALLQALIKNHLEFQEGLPYDSRLDLEAPRYRKTQYEVVAGRSAGENLKENRISSFFRNLKQFFVKRSDDLEEGLNAEERETFVKADLFDDDYAKIPITGLYDIENDLVSMDLITSMSRYMQSGIRQRTLIDMLPVARSLQSLIQSPPYEKIEDPNAIKNMNWLERVGSSLMSPVSGKGANIRADTINAFIEREFEGKNITGFGKNFAPLQKFADGLLNLSSRMFFAFNIPSALKNSMGARFQALIEASGGSNFNWTDYGKGTMWANMVTAEISMQVYKFGTKSLNYQLVELMDPSQGRFESSIKTGKGISQSAVSDVMDLSFLTNIRKWTELNTTLSVFGAMLQKELVEITDENGVVSKITYDKAWEVKDGVIKLKDGVDRAYAPGGSKYTAFVKKVHGVNINLNGAYAMFEQPMAGRYMLYRMIMFLRKYFTPMLMNRFQARIVKTPKGRMLVPRYDGNMDTIAMGYYTEFIRAMSRMFTVYKFNINNMTDTEKAAARKTLTEVGLLAFLNIFLIGMMFGWDDDDEDKYEKRRLKSGALPLPFVSEDPEHPFHIGGWFANHALNLALQVEAENDSWIPLPGMGLQDYASMLKLESIALSSGIDRYVYFFSELENILSYYVTGDTSGLYKREAGPYTWQQEGDFKFWNHLAKMLSLTGRAIEPVEDIEVVTKRNR